MTWISVNDRLPEEMKEVFVWRRNYGLAFGSYGWNKSMGPAQWSIQDFFAYEGESIDDEVTHWMPLSSIPKPQ